MKIIVQSSAHQECGEVLHNWGWKEHGGTHTWWRHASHPEHHVTVDDLGNWDHTKANPYTQARIAGHDRLSNGDSPEGLSEHLAKFHTEHSNAEGTTMKVLTTEVSAKYTKAKEWNTDIQAKNPVKGARYNGCLHTTTPEGHHLQVFAADPSPGYHGVVNGKVVFKGHVKGSNVSSRADLVQRLQEHAQTLGPKSEKSSSGVATEGHLKLRASDSDVGLGDVLAKHGYNHDVANLYSRGADRTKVERLKRNAWAHHEATLNDTGYNLRKVKSGSGSANLDKHLAGYTRETSSMEGETSGMSKATPEWHKSEANRHVKEAFKLSETADHYAEDAKHHSGDLKADYNQLADFHYQMAHASEQAAKAHHRLAAAKMEGK